MARPKSTDLLSKRAQLQFLRAFDAIRKSRDPVMTVESLAEQMDRSTRSVSHSLERDRPLRRSRALDLFYALLPTRAERQSAAAICPWLGEHVGDMMRAAKEADLEKYPPLCIPNGDFDGLAEFIVAQILSKSRNRVKYTAELSGKLRELHRYTAERFADYSWQAAAAVVEWAKTDPDFRGHFEPRASLEISQVATAFQALAYANEKSLQNSRDPKTRKRLLAKP